MSIETSIVEQMRLQEGRLFQNEQILALYLDVKCVIHDCILQNKLVTITVDEIETSLQKLAPKGVSNYHARVLYDAVRITAKLLWPSQLLLVAKPKITVLCSGILDRMRQQEAYKSLDPIQQDFIMREAFRRSLVNDCLYVFDDTVPPEEKQDEPMLDLKGLSGLEQLDADALGPDDSASHIGSRIDGPIERPVGAHSRLGPIMEDHKSVVSSVPIEEPVVVPLEHKVTQEMFQHETWKQRPTNSLVSGMDDKDTKSVIPKMIPVHVEDRKSTVSHVSVNSTASVLRKPMHVKKIIIDEQTL